MLEGVLVKKTPGVFVNCRPIEQLWCKIEIMLRKNTVHRIFIPGDSSCTRAAAQTIAMTRSNGPFSPAQNRLTFGPNQCPNPRTGTGEIQNTPHHTHFIHTATQQFCPHRNETSGRASHWHSTWRDFYFACDSGAFKLSPPDSSSALPSDPSLPAARPGHLRLLVFHWQLVIPPSEAPCCSLRDPPSSPSPSLRLVRVPLF